jgi:hypothetical protein
MVTVLLMNLFFQNPIAPQTRAEVTQYRETSTYADVSAFLNTLTKLSSNVSVRTIGKSEDGVDMLLAIMAKPMVSTAEAARRSGKLLIYIQANIHAGEVEGKEAALHLMRRYSIENPKILDKAIFLVNPIYNIDGNEKFGSQATHRPGQNGPERVGLRANGQGLDLNRDCVKAESPEMQAALQSVYSWNPDVVFDLHTTDGTRHGYPLTYGGPNHPNTFPPIYKYTFNEFFPAIRKTMRSKFQTEIFDYGNGVLTNGKWSFETFAWEPRYVTNYGGLRNAITILSEAMVYEPFEKRVKDTENFVDSCVLKLVSDKVRVQRMHREAERVGIAGQLIGTEFKIASRGDEPVLLEKGLEKPGIKTGPIRDIEAITMPVLDRFKTVKTEKAPKAYCILSDDKEVVAKLKLHGVEVLANQVKASGMSSFEISKVDVAKSAFQKHKIVTLEGRWKPLVGDFKGYLVPLNQPLGRLIFDLLNPGSTDGLSAWGSWGVDFKVGQDHPVKAIF